MYIFKSGICGSLFTIALVSSGLLHGQVGYFQGAEDLSSNDTNYPEDFQKSTAANDTTENLYTITVSNTPLNSGRISPLIYGGFIELLDDHVPGMWAEMLNDRNFEGVEDASSWCYYTGELNTCDRRWDSTGTWVYEKNRPFNGERSARLTAQKGKNGNITQSGLAVKKGMKYHFSGFFKTDTPGLNLKVILKALNPDGSWTIMGLAKLSPPVLKWTKQTVDIISGGTTDRAVFELTVHGSGHLWVDKISLIPDDNIKGWRADVVQAVKAAKPGIIRWGGSAIDPGGYKWKKGIGNRDLRVPFRNNPWGRIASNDVGLDEFLQFCELVDAEPLICISFSDGP